MNNKDIDAQFLCKDCTRYNLCEYYHRRRKDSYICKYFHLSVTPQEPKCKDCKWWKDSDGEYRRGCGAESKCPINTKTVYLGKGYCYKFEPQESER